jgi:parallel beta-helix repeat protein
MYASEGGKMNSSDAYCGIAKGRLRAAKARFWLAILVLALLVSFVTIEMPSSRAETYISGHITENTVWTAEESPYWIMGDITLDPGVSLVIEPGVQVLFTGPYSFHVEGHLFASGTQDSRIVFTSGYASPQPGDWNGITVWGSGHAEIRHARVSYGWSVVFNTGGNNTVEQTTFSYNHAGIEVLDSSANMLIGNEFRENILYGIWMSGFSSHNLIQDSTFESVGTGILIDYVNGSGNLIQSNIVGTNYLEGVAAFNSQGFEIRCNSFTENLPFGISVYESSLLIHHNNFLAPPFSAFENRSLSTWDDGSEGNYWIDYEGTDADGDGIGDTPYHIEVDSYDYYPLMNPAPCCPGNGGNIPPVAIAEPDYQEVEVGEMAWFSGNLSYDPDGFITSYVWHFGDGTGAEGAYVENSYQYPGLYDVTLWVTDDGGLTDSDTVTVLVLDNQSNPTIVMTDPPDKSVGVPLELPILVQFSKEMNTSSLVWNISPDPGGWYESWSIGNVGLMLIHENPFQPSTSYVVEIVEATDVDGNPLVPGPVPNPWEFTTIGGGMPPVATAEPSNQWVEVGEEAWFNGSMSYDPDGIIVDYSWEFGDGAVGNGAFVSHTYDFPGSYTVKLTVTDDDGLSDSDWVHVMVGGNQTDPFIAFTIPVDGEVGVKLMEDVVVWFSEPMDTPTIIWTIDPDPGCWNETWMDDMVLFLSHCNPFEDNTWYTVHVVYGDSKMGYPLVPGPIPNPWSFQTQAGNLPPVAEAEPDHQTVHVGDEAWFDGVFSYDPDGFIVSYYWDFGDGTGEEGIHVTHVYGYPGNYTATLTVVDDDGLSDSDHATVTVLPAEDPRRPILVLSAGLMNIGTFSEGTTRTIPVEVAAFYGPVTNVYVEVIDSDDLNITVRPERQDVPSGESVTFYLEIKIPEIDEEASVEGRTIEIQAFGDQVSSNVEYIDLMIRDEKANIWWTPEVIGTTLAAGTLTSAGIISYLLRRRL